VVEYKAGMLMVAGSSLVRSKFFLVEVIEKLSIFKRVKSKMYSGIAILIELWSN